MSLTKLYAFYNLYVDYWDLITKFWPGSRKWNKSLKKLVQKSLNFYEKRKEK